MNHKQRMRILRALFALILWFPVAGAAHAQFPGCDQAKTLTIASPITASGLTKLVTNNRLPNGSVKVCSYTIQVRTSTAAATFQLVSGTGTACEVNTTPLQSAIVVPASDERSIGAGVGPLPQYNLPSGYDLCLNLSAAVSSAVVGGTYAIY